jgi:hypothetical protein
MGRVHFIDLKAAINLKQVWNSIQRASLPGLNETQRLH